MKSKIKNILVPLDFSEGSKLGVDEAILIAKKFGATITCLYVSHKPLSNLADLSTDFFHYANKRALEENIEFKKKISKGNPAEMITKIAIIAGVVILFLKKPKQTVEEEDEDIFLEDDI